MPFSIIIPVIKLAGVTSKAGLMAIDPGEATLILAAPDGKSVEFMRQSGLILLLQGPAWLFGFPASQNCQIIYSISKHAMSALSGSLTNESIDLLFFSNKTAISLVVMFPVRSHITFGGQPLINAIS